MRFNPKIIILMVSACPLYPVPSLWARDIHVSRNGDDAETGVVEAPLRTIGRAAELAQPGDSVIVHAGTYREWVKPPRGGTGEDARILYRAAPGEPVVLKGSEPVASWQDQGDGVWKVNLPVSFFGDYNPFALNLSGGWLEYGSEHHRGDVYLNGEAFFEQDNPEAVRQHPLSFHGRVADGITTLWANFGKADPNLELVEVNVRESVFMPVVTGLRYITVEGFELAHSAENWQPPGPDLQMGLIGPRGGKHWIIQNCRITNARCVGIVLGHAPGVDYGDIDAFGDHIVRNNIVRRCGQAGIAGQKGATRCLIEGNLVEDTNYRKEFGGWETAAIKFHQSVDTIIRGNLIRRVRRQSHGAFGIWMDWGNQGTRITGNILLDTDAENLFLEMDHGAILVDNNVLAAGKGVRSNSEGSVFAHNLFVDCVWSIHPDTGRQSEAHEPHTRKRIARLKGIPREDKWFNNVFVRRGLEGVKTAPGYVSDHNLFLEGAGKSEFEGEHSVKDAASAVVRIEQTPLGATVHVQIPHTTAAMSCPWVDQDLVGVFSTIGQTIEDRDGRPIRVDTDFYADPRGKALPGPLAEIGAENVAVSWIYSPYK